jgi:hypothetical protein
VAPSDSFILDRVLSGRAVKPSDDHPAGKITELLIGGRRAEGGTIE